MEKDVLVTIKGLQTLENIDKRRTPDLGPAFSDLKMQMQGRLNR